MAKTQGTTAITRTQREALIRAGLASASPHEAKEQRLRRWACKIVSDLPSGVEDAERCLELAGELLRGWADGDASGQAGMGRAAQ